MKNNKAHKQIYAGIIIACSFLLTVVSCQKDPTIDHEGYEQVNLVSDVPGYVALKIDSNLVNPWGIAIGATGAFWIADNHTGLSTIYDRTGDQLLDPVAIPSQGFHFGGSPTGVVYNSTTDFAGSKFIFAGEDGTISTWTSGDSTVTVADRSAFQAVYKGIAMAADGGANYIYLANFKGNTVDVFDQDFMIVTTMPFHDPTIPAGFAPFNIQNIGGKLYVTYALQKGPDNEDDQSGPGNGYVDIYNTDGTLVKRFASQGTLNSPWGVTMAPEGFGLGASTVLIGNFGDGHINIFDTSGSFKSLLHNRDSIPVSIDGLWALTFPQNNIPAGDPNQLFFTAGPSGEEHGLFGFIRKR